ncbi:protein PAXX isoform X4 [Kogia breviceps]|uniref:protein PAXX isoform X4 n=1 Tax=Kogia breviceps TaxID=27615 RepID=UPI0034D1A8F0
MEPPPLSPPLCTLPAGPGPPRFVCYCAGEGSGTWERDGFNLYVTDAAELWSTCFTPDSLAALEARFGLSAAEDITPRFSCCRGDGHQPQEELPAGGPSALLTRPGSSERWPWTWGQEAVSGRVSHQPRLQEVPTHSPSFLCPGSIPGPCPPFHTPMVSFPLLSQQETSWWCRLRRPLRVQQKA